ncbi:hemerythrin domain-containing protein [Sorangium atrum]|uniref:Hemerythrin domain-containing protein n=1 Tax=Sorangium atrum TaxID=2995308 RepID=A0ABT5CAG7_9BACT|nr:hemerythrin domain-containing protein [Sorangium aterium]MDC0683413.1 hemerythrin domain-containing protein [Sorangium aterium]
MNNDGLLRRTLVLATSSIGMSAVLGACARQRGAAAREPKQEGGAGEGDEVTPGEDLMREHGVLRRVMFLYDEAIRRLDGPADVPGDVLLSAAGVVRRVIEDYHEKLEEDFLFPRFERAGKHTDLVAVLRSQHQAGRLVTADVLTLAREPLREQAARRKLADRLRAFNRMYRPHAAREDTVLFPALRALVGAKAYADLGEQFEEKEHRMLGDEGFEKAVAEVAELEVALGIADLASFTPT